ncbi:hypothetical protein B0A53_04022 [Rhodotorula sp. CCFEE 5036]|nr:hypothetical protein B0A53_04022 [Rhodotorula sp. CCFEE 5036]
MATTKTYLCYGIPVTNESLTYATLAYQRLEGPFRFTRLVQKRRREGTLQTSPTSAVGSLPVELWDLVRYKLTDLELSATKRKFMIDHACGDCSEEASEEDPRISYWNNLSACSCPSADPEDWPQSPASQPSAVAFIALSPSPYLPPERINANDHASFIEPEVDEDRVRNDGIWPLSFDKPANADLRFHHLLRDLRLSPLKVSDGKIGVARARRSKRTRTYEGFNDNEEVRPKWYLFTTVEHVERDPYDSDDS